MGVQVPPPAPRIPTNLKIISTGSLRPLDGCLVCDWLRKRSHGGIEDLGALRPMLCTPNSVNMFTILSCINASDNFFDHRMILVLCS